MHGITVYLSVAFDIGATVSSKEQFSDFVEDAKDIFGDIDLGHYCPSTYNVSSRKFLADFYESAEKKIHIRDEEFIIKYRLSSSGYLQMILRKELSSLLVIFVEGRASAPTAARFWASGVMPMM